MYAIDMYEKFADAPGFPRIPQRVQTCEVAETREEATELLKEVISQWEALGYTKQRTEWGEEIFSTTPELGEKGYFIFFKIVFKRDI